MNVSRLRIIIITISFFVLIFGGLYSLDFGSFLPTFACYFVGYSKAGACFLYPLQSALDSADIDKYISIFIDFLLFSLLVIIIGRAWCGWICPLGFLMDALDYIREKLGINYMRFSEKLRYRLKPLKWIFLGIALIIPFWVAFPVLFPHVARDLRAPFCSLCPGRYILPMITGDFLRVGVDYFSVTSIVLSTLGLSITVFALLGTFVKRRFFCSYCPMGLIIGFYRKISFLKIKKDTQKCTRCESCFNACSMEVEEKFKERDSEDVTHLDCILCMRCIEYCPEDGALYATFLGKKIFVSSRQGFLKRQGIIKKNGERVFGNIGLYIEQKNNGSK